MEDQKDRQDNDFGILLLRLFQKTGQIEASFTSKMLASLNPDMPIWDSRVLKNLNLRLTGRTPELKLSNAVVLYGRICDWYQSFLKTEEARQIIHRFDTEFPECQGFSDTKKVDFILWANE